MVHKPGSLVLMIPLGLLLMGARSCTEVDVTDPKTRDTVIEINQVFQRDYRTMLRDIGTRHFAIDQATAMRAMTLAVQRVGFTVVSREGNHYLGVTGPAPTPLDPAEWQLAIKADEQLLKSIAVKHLGIKGNFARFETAGLNIDGTITFIPTTDGVDISITMRMREIAAPPPESILPRRDYPPPTAVRVGFEKIWRTFVQQAVPYAVAANPD